MKTMLESGASLAARHISWRSGYMITLYQLEWTAGSFEILS